MKDTIKISNAFLTYSFITIATGILLVGTLFVIYTVHVLANPSGTHLSQTIFTFGIICLVSMPYCFPILKSMRILEIQDPNPGDKKISIYAPIFANEIRIPDEITFNQITGITRDKIFSNLLKITFEEDGGIKKIYSFIKQEQMKFILNLSNHPPA